MRMQRKSASELLRALFAGMLRSLRLSIMCSMGIWGTVNIFVVFHYGDFL